MKTRYKVAIGCLCAPVVLVVLFFGLIFVAWTPWKMRTPPSEEWKATWILPSVPVDSTNLVFIGGISAREPMMVYELRGQLPSLEGFRREETREREMHLSRFKMAAESFGFSFDAPSDSEVLLKFVETENDGGSLYVVRGNDRIYLVYERL